MSIIKVNKETCIDCGRCREVCPTQIIVKSSAGLEVNAPERCIACGQCVAICPVGAMDNERNPLARQDILEKYPVIPMETASLFLRARRSTRCFKKEKISRELMLEILNTARFAPTAANSQGLSFIVVENPKVLQNIIAATVDWMEQEGNNPQNPWGPKYQRYVQIYRETKKDVILRGATALIVAVADADNPNAYDNARFSLEYAELYASAAGAGTCWGGYVQMCAKAEYPPLLEALQVPRDTVVAGILLSGIPKYTFKRLPDRNPLKVTWL